ncbi:hypothetical protein GE21DRAFT_1212909 [Neurospora crassa]|nr:hypothetical protein B1D1.260 [imported] - Neurospora crassa [Neurospora crassa]KHE82685.1 hypothetical protein GE21DRAFT_1212909 [Neurospora crassa]
MLLRDPGQAAWPLGNLAWRLSSSPGLGWPRPPPRKYGTIANIGADRARIPCPIGNGSPENCPREHRPSVPCLFRCHPLKRCVLPSSALRPQSCFEFRCPVCHAQQLRRTPLHGCHLLA